MNYTFRIRTDATTSRVKSEVAQGSAGTQTLYKIYTSDILKETGHEKLGLIQRRDKQYV